jgi:hypothetical protein
MEAKIQRYIVAFFCVGLIEIVAEYFFYQPIIVVLKPLLPLILLLAYSIEFKKANILLIGILISSSITNLLFIWVDEFLFFGVSVFSIHRILMIVFLLKFLNVRDFLPLTLGTIPFFMFSGFLFLDVVFESSQIQNFIFFHNILVSILCGIALSQYIMKDSSGVTWLMLAVFLFFCLHILVFVELFYVRYQFLRPMAMLLNVGAFYAFYRFVVTIERENVEIQNKMSF